MCDIDALILSCSQKVDKIIIANSQNKSTEVQTLGAQWRARVSKRMRLTTNWWARFSCYSWSLASSRRVWRGLTILLDSMRKAIHALRCIFWCPWGTQSTRIDQTVVSYPVRGVFAYCLFRALALQQSSFRENRVSFVRLTNTREVRCRVTDRQTQLATHARRG